MITIKPIPCSIKKIRHFFSNIIGLPEGRNKRKSVLEITKIYFLKFKIIQQEMNKMAIHTHVIFRPDIKKKTSTKFRRTGYRYYLFAMHVKIILA